MLKTRLNTFISKASYVDLVSCSRALNRALLKIHELLEPTPLKNNLQTYYLYNEATCHPERSEGS